MLNLWAPKLNIANFVTQDYSDILHAYFVDVFCCSPLRERDFVLINSSLALAILLYSMMKSVWSDETGRRNKSSKQDPCIGLCCSLVFIFKKNWNKKNLNKFKKIIIIIIIIIIMSLLSVQSIVLQSIVD